MLTVSIVDILGLVKENNAAHICERGFHKWLEKRRSNNMVTHKPLWNREASFITSSSKTILMDACDVSRSESKHL